LASIKLHNICKAYDKHQVHEDLNLTINDGECFTLLGPSGCGKSVLMRMLAGFEAPDKGKIYIGDRLMADGEGNTLISPDQRDLGMVFQEYAVWPHMTVFDNIAYPLKIKKESKEEIEKKVMHIVDIVNLNGLEKRLPSQLSGGQQQRVALGRALIADSSLLLLDEPLNNLDANLREEMRFEIKDLQRKFGITIFYVTHDQEIAMAISDRIAIMDKNGAIVQVGEPSEVFEHPVNDYVFEFLGVSSFLPVTRTGEDYFCGNEKIYMEASGNPSAKNCYAAFRPTDVSIARGGNGTRGKVLRYSFLGADIDYLIEIGGHTIRAQMNAYEASEKDLLLQEGDECVMKLRGVSLFEGNKGKGV
jgi:iron(III) transport system ATP-binding protein